jgi:O-antigen/teichoic acid export membrane protein
MIIAIRNATVWQWMKANSVILVNAGSLIGTTAVTSILGFAYWLVATQHFAPAAVGFASASVSAMLFLGTICILGLGTMLIGELPQQSGRKGSLISAALLISAASGACFGVGFAIIAPLVSRDFAVLRANIWSIAIFAVGVSITAITLVLDQSLIGLLRGQLQFWRNTLFATIKLAVLLAVGLGLTMKTGLSIYATWGAGNIISLLALAGYAFVHGDLAGVSLWPQWKQLHRLRFVALQHHILNLTMQMPTQVLPVIVTVMFSATVNAWFYVSLMLANFVFTIPFSLTTVLYAVNTAQPDILAARIRLTVSLALGASIFASGILLLDTQQILGMFGHIYAEQAVWSLRILALGAFPQIIRTHFIALCRIKRRMAQAMAPIIAGSFLEIVAAAIGGRIGGLDGLSLGWVVALTLEALCMLWPVLRAIWPRKPRLDAFPPHIQEATPSRMAMKLRELLASVR